VNDKNSPSASAPDGAVVKVYFQTDADFDRRSVRATSRREPAIDLQLATAARGGAGLRGIPDAQVLVVAAQEGRSCCLTIIAPCPGTLATSSPPR
jgi:hypothetical protein